MHHNINKISTILLVIMHPDGIFCFWKQSKVKAVSLQNVPRESFKVEDHTLDSQNSLNFISAKHEQHGKYDGQ